MARLVWAPGQPLPLRLLLGILGILRMSPIAYALLTNLTRRPPGANVVMEELVEALHSSKTAIRAAFNELSEAGYLSYNQVS